MNTQPAILEHLESDVLARIAAHRNRRPNAALPAGLALGVLALGFGLLVGWSQAQPPGSAADGANFLLADEARLAPAELLASN